MTSIQGSDTGSSLLDSDLLSSPAVMLVPLVGRSTVLLAGPDLLSLLLIRFLALSRVLPHAKRSGAHPSRRFPGGSSQGDGGRAAIVPLR